MKRILSALVLMAPMLGFANPFLADLHHDAHAVQASITAQRLAIELQHASVQAQVVARQAAVAGIAIRARNFQNLASEARQLSNEVRREVIVPLRHGGDLRLVRRNVDSLRREVFQLNQAVGRLLNVPAPLLRNIREASHAYAQLRRQVNLR